MIESISGILSAITLISAILSETVLTSVMFVLTLTMLLVGEGFSPTAASVTKPKSYVTPCSNAPFKSNATMLTFAISSATVITSSMLFATMIISSMWSWMMGAASATASIAAMLSAKS